MATIASLLVTSKPLEPSRLSWITAGFRRIPLFMSSSAKAINQFSTGDANFNYLGILLTVTPAAVVIIGFLNTRVAGEDLGTKRTLQSTSIYFGIGALASMGFFLIPVARHSVILAAMGWNPIHAMRIHIISGYAFFWFSIIHGITYVPVWFMDKNDGVYPSVRDQVVPGRVCWVGDQNYKTFFTVNDGKCRYQFFGFTGIVVGVILLFFTATSLPYVRRYYYRFFYWCHIWGGIALIFATIWHWSVAVIFMIPSIAIYLSTTSPTLVNKMAEYYTGGHKVVSAKPLRDADGCYEFVVAITPDASREIRTTSCFVKMSVPKISMVWHPFTVMPSPGDKTTLRMFIRPIGDFTRELVDAFSPESGEAPPRVLIDGFYRGDYLPLQACYAHDHLTIVCGGLTVTPYLTMIPAMMNALLKQAIKEGGIKVKTIILHWAVREQGLMNHIKDNYLDFTMRQAQALVDEEPEFKYHIKIYHTGAGKDIEQVEKTDKEFGSQGNSSGDIASDTSGSGEDPSSAGQSKMDGSTDEEPLSDMADDVKTSTTEMCGVLPVDNGRLMPGRYGSIYHNIPSFVVTTVLSWMFFYICFRFYRRGSGFPGFHETRAEYNQIMVVCWGFVLLLAVQLPAGMLVEAIYRLADKYFGLPKSTESFDDIEDGTEDLPLVADGSDHVTVEYRSGRPGVDAIFESCREDHVQEPGIFLCAPVALMESVKQEARKENISYLLHTRYAVYEEPYEF